MKYILVVILCFSLCGCELLNSPFCYQDLGGGKKALWISLYELSNSPIKITPRAGGGSFYVTKEELQKLAYMRFSHTAIFNEIISQAKMCDKCECFFLQKDMTRIIDNSADKIKYFCANCSDVKLKSE